MTRFRDNLIEILGAAIITLSMAAFIVIVLARSAIARNAVSVQIVLAEGLAPVQADRVQLQQVILNSRGRRAGRQDGGREYRNAACGSAPTRRRIIFKSRVSPPQDRGRGGR